MKSPNPTDRDQPAIGRESSARPRRGAASFNNVVEVTVNVPSTDAQRFFRVLEAD
jgi:hypothetical protein